MKLCPAAVATMRRAGLVTADEAAHITGRHRSTIRRAAERWFPVEDKGRPS